MKKPKLQSARRLPRKFGMALIRLYQRTISPDHGPLKTLFPYGYCRFSPSCSMYGYLSIEQYGLFKGSWMALKRIIRCNPWNPGGIDEVPHRSQFTN